MDRTMIAPWKAEEKDLSEKLNQKLRGLALIHPMNDEMKKLLSWDMFLKPNQPAFFQVMHYLFRILDPAEFKRRFFWPITDKKAEATFRTTTVDYLKHLNAKHNLNWANIKSYLVVMPGGMKFINFLLDLVSFVIQDQIKQREKALSVDIDISQFRDWSAERMEIANKFRKDYVSAYIEELDENTAKLRECTQKIRQKFSEISAATGVDEALLSDDKFLMAFEASNRQKCEELITLQAARIAELETPLNSLKDNIDKFQDKQTIHKLNKEAANNALRSIQTLCGIDADHATANVNSMMRAFNKISETIAEQLDANDHCNESNEFVAAGLETLRAELQQIDQQVSDVQRSFNARDKEQSINGNASQASSSLGAVPTTPLRHLDPHLHAGSSNHPLLMKFVSTPPIRTDMASGVRSAHVRLPLQDDFNANQLETTCNNLLVAAVPRSARKVKAEYVSELNNTTNRTKIMDPMQLLRTINKKSSHANTTAANISSLGSKWKAMQASFNFDEAPSTMPTSPKPTIVTETSPFTPLNCNERTRVERMPQATAADISNNNSNGSLYAIKSVALMKVLDASLNVQNLTTSPSGRLDALVPGPLPEQQAIPRLQLNDQTINDSQQVQSIKEEIVATQLNTQPPKFNLDFSGDNDDLGNISDNVLKDISF
ncbi:PREDICTED: uncharacterized protein LOC108621331 isoform X1 [Drosophila arizonae]|uniref:Uncharacterized protein LOC108621331 isoform X1 n=1 Tax=Drosophila arizonae TaxID=7263 RepID=A0ABM1Q3N6_DROAR|nr:PREDICTED: uncharacterized protein LOC108621331 isoform X1 [Drosophila arizonae]